MAEIACNEADLDEFQELDICDDESGKIAALSYIELAAFIATFMPGGSIATLAANLADITKWQALEASGDAVIIRRVRGSMPKATETTEEGFGFQEEQVTGKQWQILFKHLGVDKNTLFYDKVTRMKSIVSVSVTFDGAGILPVDFKGKPLTISISTSPVVEEGSKTKRHWDGAIKWAVNRNPEFYPVPKEFFVAKPAAVAP